MDFIKHPIYLRGTAMTFHFMGNDLAVIVNTMLKSSKLSNLEIMSKLSAIHFFTFKCSYIIVYYYDMSLQKILLTCKRSKVRLDMYLFKKYCCRKVNGKVTPSLLWQEDVGPSGRASSSMGWCGLQKHLSWLGSRTARCNCTYGRYFE